MSIFTEDFINEFFFKKKNKNYNKNNEKNVKKHGLLTKEEVSYCKSLLKSIARSTPIVKDVLDFDSAANDKYEDYLNYGFDYIIIASIDLETEIFSEDEYGTEYSDARKKAGYPEDFNSFISEYKKSINKIESEFNKKNKFNDIELYIDEAENTKFKIVSKKPKEEHLNDN